MNLLWRDTGKTVRFIGVDGRAAVGLVLVLVHVSWITFVTSVCLMVAFGVLERFDYTLPNAGRKLRVIISGKKKRANNPVLRKRYRSD